jgi:ceramide glucosyltransferase
MHLAIASLFVAACSAWNVAGWVALQRATRARATTTSTAPAPVSVLKPLNGADEGLTENLRGFFEQDHPELELVFGVTSPSDPALAVVARLRAEFPRMACRVVIHDGSAALNPKVRNLLGMLPYATHDLLLISDSNVRAPKHYVSELARLHASAGVGIVTNLFAGSDEQTLGAALENVQLNGFCAAGSALPTLSGDAAVIGKSTLFSRATLDSLGGLSRLSCVLAEDFILGKMFENAGLRVVIAPTVLENPNRKLSLRATFARHLRWSMLRWRLRPLAALLRAADQPALDAAVCVATAWLQSFALARAGAHHSRFGGLGSTARLAAGMDPGAARTSAGACGATRLASGCLQAARDLARPTLALVLRHAALRRIRESALRLAETRGQIGRRRLDRANPKYFQIEHPTHD